MILYPNKVFSLYTLWKLPIAIMYKAQFYIFFPTIYKHNDSIKNLLAYDS